jgi:hypothetical protein
MRRRASADMRRLRDRGTAVGCRLVVIRAELTPSRADIALLSRSRSDFSSSSIAFRSMSLSLELRKCGWRDVSSQLLRLQIARQRLGGKLLVAEVSDQNDATKES